MRDYRQNPPTAEDIYCGIANDTTVVWAPAYGEFCFSVVTQYQANHSSESFQVLLSFSMHTFKDLGDCHQVVSIELEDDPLGFGFCLYIEYVPFHLFCCCPEASHLSVIHFSMFS